MDLKGAVALVTGGNGGLGQRICHALAQEGAHVAVMYAQQPRPGRRRRAANWRRAIRSTRTLSPVTSPTARPWTGWSAR